MQIKELNTEQFRDLIRETVAEVLDEYIDPDEGKTIKISVIERLSQQTETIPAAEAMQKLGIVHFERKQSQKRQLHSHRIKIVSNCIKIL